jgi:hypothetical protein
MDMTDVTEELLHSADDLHCPIASHMNMLMNGEARAFNGVSTRLPLEGRGRINYFRINAHLQTASLAKDDLSTANINNLCSEAERMINNQSHVLDEIISRLPSGLPKHAGAPTSERPMSVGTHASKGMSEPAPMPADKRVLPANWW